MLNRSLLAAALILLGSVASAHATNVTYDILGDPTELTGTITLSGTTIVSGDFSFIEGRTTYTFDGTASTNTTAPGIVLTTFSDGLGDVFDFDIMTPVNLDGTVTICSVANSCPTGRLTSDLSLLNPATGPNDNVNAGFLKAEGAAVTPEPSSLILLGTGAFGVIGAARRRFLNA